MDRGDRELFESIAGPLLTELGYATGDGPGTEPRGETLREITGRRVQRAIQAAVVSLEHVTVCRCGLRSNIDDVEPASWGDIETEFEWWHRGY